MELSGPAKRLTIYIGEQDHVGHHSLATEIVKRAHTKGLAGVTVFRGVEGYGKSNHIHTTRILSLSDDLPVCIVIVDSAQAIEGFAEQLHELVEGGLVTIEDVEVLRYVHHGGGPQQPAE
jgi:PII-like signaling protein